MLVFIDTQIWVFAQKKPIKSSFSTTNEYEENMKIHELSHNFITEQIETNQIAITFHQISEIYHALAFRGKKIPVKFVEKYCLNLMNADFCTFYPLKKKHFQDAISKSKESRIHIWDYLCILPLQSDIEIAYSCDKHFQSHDFKQLLPKIENPVGKWFLL